MEAKMSENYVRIYENVFSDELCDRLVAKFEENKDNHQRVTAHKLGSLLNLTFVRQDGKKNRTSFHPKSM